MVEQRVHEQSVADAFLALLASRGIEHLICNAGTDFAPIAEAFAKAQALGRPAPRPILVPHENAAVSMAHGYYMMTGRIAAVMVHVTVGTANAINGLYNAARSNVPMLMLAGRTPISETDSLGSRDNFIHWAQEMFDQAGMVRELVKWDYELRTGAQLETIVDRAIAIAQSEPKGPVYLTLPREVLASPMIGAAPGEHPGMVASTPAQADQRAVETLAEWLGQSSRPLIITSSLGHDPAASEALSKLTEAHAIPVVQYRPTHMSLAPSHPMALGWDATEYVPKADLILVFDCDVPWLPDKGDAACRVVHVGADPLYSRYPARGFRTDLAIRGRSAHVLERLAELLAKKGVPGAEDRREWVAADREKRANAADAVRRQCIEKSTLTPALLSHYIDQACDDDTIVLNEYPLALDQLAGRTTGNYFSHSSAGGLGWALGAALGAKLAAPDRTVVACVGDGAYMFGNPTPVHFVSRALDLPVLFVINNNQMWGAVHRATLGMYPQGYASRANEPPLAVLQPSPEYEKVVEASGGYGERVERVTDLPAALERAMRSVREEKRQAVLNVVTVPQMTRSS